MKDYKVFFAEVYTGSTSLGALSPMMLCHGDLWHPISIGVPGVLGTVIELLALPSCTTYWSSFVVNLIIQILDRVNITVESMHK